MIGGNTIANVQLKTSSKNEYGALTDTWQDVTTVKGFLDFTGGDGSYKSNFKGKLEETTHIFICDYNEKVACQATPTTSRLIINNQSYEVLMIDDPMSLHKHLEIMLKYSEVLKNGGNI